jgi:DNA polymerase-3 subunit epsilon
MRDKYLAFVDLETTGLDPTRHEITEVGIIVAKQETDLFGKRSLIEVAAEEILLVPDRLEDADPGALRVNRFHTRDRSGALPQREGLARVAELISGTVFVAQNVTFDWSFLFLSGKRHGIDFDRQLFYHKLDLGSMAIGKLYQDPSQKKFTLRAITERFGVKNLDAHTALSDARATFEAAKRLLDLP